MRYLIAPITFSFFLMSCQVELVVEQATNSAVQSAVVTEEEKNSQPDSADQGGEQDSNSENEHSESDQESGSTDTEGESNTEPEDEVELVGSVIDDDAIFEKSGYTVTGKSLNDTEAELTQFEAMTAVKKAIETRANDVVESIGPGLSTNPENVKRVERIMSEPDWEFLFPKRAPEYTYRGFLQAVGKFPAFCGAYETQDSDQVCRKSLATMFAHFTQETGGHTDHWDVPQWRQALVHVREMGWDESMRGGYNGECDPSVWQGQAWPCGTFDDGDFKSYFGRGAKQLSYNYNYGPFSEAMYGDVSVLLDHPEWVADTWLNLASAVFFFVYPQPPKPSMLHVIDGTWQPNARDIENGLLPGFGVTTQIINGGVECGGSAEHIQSQNRIHYYYDFADYLGVTIAADEVMGCAAMKQFDDTGAGALPIYWEQDWSWRADTPEGESFQCQLVGYQTPYSAFKAGDYGRCVVDMFDMTRVQ